jgi:hypothetical protein
MRHLLPGPFFKRKEVTDKDRNIAQWQVRPLFKLCSLKNQTVKSYNVKNLIKMKKLGKLQINLEKMMKNEELTSLRGGYDEGEGPVTCDYRCTVYMADGTFAFEGPACGRSDFGVRADCNMFWNPGYYCICI